MHDNKHLQHSENEPKIDRNSETRWNLLSNIKTDDLSFKRERNRVDWGERLRRKGRKVLRRRI